MEKTLSTPLTDEAVAGLRSGDRVLLTGTMLTARDAAHKRMIELLDAGEPLPSSWTARSSTTPVRPRPSRGSP